jgi:hypothetical protein
LPKPKAKNLKFKENYEFRDISSEILYGSKRVLLFEDSKLTGVEK